MCTNNKMYKCQKTIVHKARKWRPPQPPPPHVHATRQSSDITSDIPDVPTKVMGKKGR